MHTQLSCIQHAIKQLENITQTPRLEAELLLGLVLKKDRAYLITYPEKIVSADEFLLFEALLARRAQGEPLAYLAGLQSFWSTDFLVNPHVLIPRCETEDLIDWILTHGDAHKALHVADLGTGSGAIALTLAKERPLWKIDATDKFIHPLNVAKENAKRMQIDQIYFYQGDWCEALPKKNYDLIISNPPYIADNDPHLEKLIFEPLEALVATDNGLGALATIIKEAPHYLASGGKLILEHGFQQQPAVCNLLEKFYFRNIKGYQDLNKNPRFVVAEK